MKQLFSLLLAVMVITAAFAFAPKEAFTDVFYHRAGSVWDDGAGSGCGQTGSITCNVSFSATQDVHASLILPQIALNLTPGVYPITINPVESPDEPAYDVNVTVRSKNSQ